MSFHRHTGDFFKGFLLTEVLLNVFQRGWTFQISFLGYNKFLVFFIEIVTTEKSFRRYFIFRRLFKCLTLETYHKRKSVQIFFIAQKPIPKAFQKFFTTMFHCPTLICTFPMVGHTNMYSEQQ